MLHRLGNLTTGEGEEMKTVRIRPACSGYKGERIQWLCY